MSTPQHQHGAYTDNSVTAMKQYNDLLKSRNSVWKYSRVILRMHVYHNFLISISFWSQMKTFKSMRQLNSFHVTL